ncbi:MAG: rod shape-determining protein MreC, partial [Bacteroidaceae bacterium]|nr:rod shape-determining protein MreC [Bacteroidaceae bacterium]
MRALFDFFIRHGSAFLFVLLEGLSLLILFSFGDTRNLLIFSSAGTISGSIMKARSSIGQYFSLREENTGLALENAMLLERVR